MGILRWLFGITTESYKLDSVVSCRTIDPTWSTDLNRHVICDLDKTYVETEFESWVKMARIPFERPHEKITVPGASEVLQSLRWSVGSEDHTNKKEVLPRAGLSFVSSSPPQLRAALEGKLVLDQLDWTSDTFKNQTYNLRMARIDLLRHHIAYKTRAILDVISRTPENCKLWMIGDNAEYDPFVYQGIRLFLDKRFDLEGLGHWMIGANVEKNVVSQVLRGHENLQERNYTVEGILIRKLEKYGVVNIKGQTENIHMFDNWLQIAWLWATYGLICPTELLGVVRSFHNIHGVPVSHLKWCFNQLSTQMHLYSEEVQASIMEVQRFFEHIHVDAKNVLGWSLNLGDQIEADRNMGKLETPYAVAKEWYFTIERARSKRIEKR